MDRVIIDELSLEELNKYDIVMIEKNNEIDIQLFTIINDNKYCNLEELCFFLYENKDKPKLFNLTNKMIFYKIGVLDSTIIDKYISKLEVI